jgi:hypothetical protein
VSFETRPALKDGLLQLLNSTAVRDRRHADYAVSTYRFAWSKTTDERLAQEVVPELFLKLARDADALTSACSERAMILSARVSSRLCACKMNPEVPRSMPKRLRSITGVAEERPPHEQTRLAHLTEDVVMQQFLFHHWPQGSQLRTGA